MLASPTGFGARQVVPVALALAISALMAGCGSSGSSDYQDQNSFSSGTTVYADGTYARGYTASASSDGTATVTMTASDFTPYVFVYRLDNGGTTLTWLTDSSQGRAASRRVGLSGVSITRGVSRSSIVIDKSGSNPGGATTSVTFNVYTGENYVIVANEWEPLMAGNYSIDFTNNINNSVQAFDMEPFLGLSTIVSGQLTSSSQQFSDGSYFDAYHFTGGTTGTATLTMVSSILQPYLEVHTANADGTYDTTSLAASTAGQNSISFSITQGQDYILFAGTESGATTLLGPYHLVFSPEVDSTSIQYVTTSRHAYGRSVKPERIPRG